MAQLKKSMDFRTVNILDLMPADYNPRKDLKPGDKEYEKIKRSIHEFGYVDPIIVNSDMTVIGGHQRLKVLQEIGYVEVDCVVVDIPKEKEKALNVALNKISGDWDYGKLEEVISDLKELDFDISVTGFDASEINDLFVDKGVKEDDFDVDGAVAAVEEPTTKLGDVWQFGGHRLVCGSATIQTDIDKLMNGVFADMVFTDPPYNVDYEGVTKDKLKIQNDKMSNDKFYQFLLDSYISMFEILKPGCPIYICHADFEGINFRTAMKDAGFELKQCIIWVKNSIVMGRQDHHSQHEPILYGWKPGAAHKWYGGRKQSTVIKPDDGVFVDKTAEGYQLTFNNGINKVVLNVPGYEVVGNIPDEQTTTWYVDKPVRSAEHPTMKPIKLCARAIKNSSKEKDIVVDLFGGSGSTLIAAEQTNRKCYMTELDPVYCDIIVQRWEKLTGGKATLVKQ